VQAFQSVVHAVAIMIDEAFESMAALFKEKTIAPTAQATAIVFFARYIVVMVSIGINNIINKSVVISI
jgi:hypothetical protein